MQGVSFCYGRTPVLEDVTLELNPFEVLGVVGPNGAGKSTLIKLLTRVLTPDFGAVTLSGRDVRNCSRLELARQIAVVPQAGDVPEAFTALELVMMGRTPHLGFLARETRCDLEIVERVMRAADVWRFRDRVAASLSGGERQRVLLALALAQEPRYLLLDKPTNHLDLKYQTEILSLAKREAAGGLGVLAVLHDLNLAARACDRVLVLNAGRVVAAGKPEEIFTEALLREVYQTDAHVFTQPGGHLPVILPRV
ncbi:ABC transporter ATP-binding protein [soil metagenome]